MDSKILHSVEHMEKLFNSRMCEYEDKLQRVTAGTPPIHSDISSLSLDFSEFKTFVCQTFLHFKTQIESISSCLDRHETAMRRKVLLFHGIPEKRNENLNDSILHIISKQLKIVDVKLDHLEVCHRLGGTQGKTRPVLVRFSGMEYRRLVWDGKTSLKGSGITISEFLTKTRHQVFIAARKHFSINNCWSAEGKVIVLTPDKTRRTISTMGELETLIALFPASACAATPENPVPAAATSPTVISTSPVTATPKGKRVRKARL